MTDTKDAWSPKTHLEQDQSRQSYFIMSMQLITWAMATAHWIRKIRLFLITKPCFEDMMLFFCNPLSLIVEKDWTRFNC